MEANNMKAMREAVKSLMDNLKIHLLQPIDQITINRAELEAMVKDCSEALAKPPRNCDVGTEQEQARRFLKYCVKQDCEKACPFRDCKNSYECAFAWAQMTYEELDTNK